MVALRFATLAFAALSSFTSLASAVEVEGIPASVDDIQAAADAQGGVPSKLNINVDITFPDAEIFGVKLVNGRPTRTLLSITNHEAEPVQVLIATGALLSPTDVPGAPDPPVILRNLTATRYGVQLPPNAQETLPYTFSTILQPQDLTLDLKLLVQKGEAIYTLGLFGETVSVVEAPISIFDPQIIFLYLFLAAAFAGTIYFIYTTWITTLFPQKRRGGKGGERAKRSTTGTKKVEPADQAAVVGADGPAVTTGAKAYDESWIPASHLKKPTAKKVGGRTKSRAA